MKLPVSFPSVGVSQNAFISHTRYQRLKSALICSPQVGQKKQKLLGGSIHMRKKKKGKNFLSDSSLLIFFSLLVLLDDEVDKFCWNDDFLYKSLAIKVWLDSLMGFCHLKHLFLTCTL